MCFDPTECKRALQGVNPNSVQALDRTAGTLAEHQAKVYGTRVPWQKQALIASAGHDLRTFTRQLEAARIQSSHPEGLPNVGPTKMVTDEELLAWATGFAWRNGRDDG